MSHRWLLSGKNVVLAALLAGASALLVVPLQTVRADAPILAGRWHLNEATNGTTADSSGNENDGIVVDARRVKGRFGNALSFDATKWVRVPNSPALEPAIVSVESWARADTNAPYRYIVAKGSTNACTAASYALSAFPVNSSDPDGGLIFYVRLGSSDSAWAASPNAGPSVWDGDWHHIAGTYDGVFVRLYVDGAQVGDGTLAPGSISYGLNQANDLLMGAYRASVYNPSAPFHCVPHFVGSIDEVRVWDGVLTAEEIAKHAHSNSAEP